MFIDIRAHSQKDLKTVKLTDVTKLLINSHYLS